MSGPRASTVDGVLRRSAGRTPDRVALVDRSWTYAELDAGVSRTAAHRLGLSPGDRVATVGPRNQSGKLLKRVLRDQL
jgi:fatty-acyl-CoA synthase